MVLATIWHTKGIVLPDFNLAAFKLEYLEFTIGGYVRILAVMTGIEVFANLVAAYDGDDQAKSRKAFGSLLIIMGTAAATMLIVGPSIFQLSDPTNSHVSVFTQTMDALLPAPLPRNGQCSAPGRSIRFVRYQVGGISPSIRNCGCGPTNTPTCCRFCAEFHDRSTTGRATPNRGHPAL